MAAALLHPERVSRLGVVDMAPVEYPDTQWSGNGAIIEAMRSLSPSDMASRKEADEALEAHKVTQTK